MPVVIPIPDSAFLAVFLVAAVALAAWTFIRFRTMGPRTLTGGFFALMTAFALICALPSLIDGVMALQVPDARDVVVFGLGLPTFTYFFLASGWFLRSLLEFPGRLS